MPGISSKLSRIAQGGFILSLLVLSFGIVNLFTSGPNPSSQAIDRHLPYAYAFLIVVALSVLLAIIATIINWRSHAK
jgi:hypothetical protein